ncbi:hypothetical protein KCU73_g2909, partial [Aureobasidium melanogenum]
MPNEILTEICAHACDDGSNIPRGREWLRAVRLTCKQLYTPATLEFGKRFLENLFVMMTDYSLEAMNDICAHPLLGPRAHAVRVDAYRSDEWNPSDIYKEIANAVLTRNIGQMEAAENKLQEHLKTYREEYDLEDSGRAEDLLVKALSMIKQHNKSVSIALIGTDDEMPIGYLRRWDKTYQFNNRFQMKTTFCMLVSAVQRSKCRINKFSCRIPPEYEGLIQDNNPEIDIAEVATSSGIFTDLECMRLEVCHYIPSFTAGLCGVLGLAAKISNLELSTRVGDFGEYWAPESYEATGAMLRSVCCGSLKRVCLSSLVSKPGSLKDFLLKHRHTLKEVLFDFVILVGAWVEILRWIRDNLDLQIISLSELHRMSVSEYENVDVDERTVHVWCQAARWSGPENIRRGLNQLLENKRKEEKEPVQEEL